MWDYMSYGPFADRDQFDDWLNERAALDDPYVYAVLDPKGRALGIAALMRITPDMGVIEVGHIAYSPALAAHAARHRGAISARALRLRNAWLPAL